MPEGAPNIFDELLNATDVRFSGQVMALRLSGRAKSRKAAERMARLLIAVEEGDAQALELSLGEGSDPNEVFFNETLLGIACRSGRPESVRVLLKHGADPNLTCEWTPLTQAVNSGNLDCVRLLVEGGATLNRPLPSDQPELLAASLAGNTAIIEFLLSRGASPDLFGTVFITNARKVTKVTPLMGAAWRGSLDICRLLLSAGASHNATDSEKSTALDWAKRCRAKKTGAKVSELLATAGVQQGQAEEDASWPDLGKAAHSADYKKLVREVSLLAGVRPVRLQNMAGPVAGGHAFAIPADYATELVLKHQPALLERGAIVFVTNGQAGGPLGDALGILPTHDPIHVAAAMEVEGPNSRVDNAMVIRWLQALGSEEPYQLIGVGSDFVRGRFLGPVRDAIKLAKRITELCPDAQTPPDGLAVISKDLAVRKEFFLWWD